jgi:hypothetical protein
MEDKKYIGNLRRLSFFLFLRPEVNIEFVPEPDQQEEAESEDVKARAFR